MNYTHISQLFSQYFYVKMGYKASVNLAQSIVERFEGNQTIKIEHAQAHAENLPNVKMLWFDKAIGELK